MMTEEPEIGRDGMSDVTGKRDEVPVSTAGSNLRDDAKRLARRRLLLGAAALPSVYTLTSGAAVAGGLSIAVPISHPTLRRGSPRVRIPSGIARAGQLRHRGPKRRPDGLLHY